MAVIVIPAESTWAVWPGDRGERRKAMLAAAFVLTPVVLVSDGEELFERSIRPLLVERCYRCHNSHERAEAGLALDHRDGLLRGGRRGPAVLPGDPGGSPLLVAVRHDDGVPRMPRDEPRLEPHEIEALETWIRLGAPDPRDRPPSEVELATETSWESVRDRRLAWWSFQPLDLAGPTVTTPTIDATITARAHDQGLTVNPLADPATRLRRLKVVLTGLPPTPDEVEQFLAEPTAERYAEWADRWLDSPAYAERWARHWMDLFRYAESHGSEGDPTIPNAYLYRDYLIRAFDEGVSYRRLLLEHVAGDLLEPRFIEGRDTDDSAIGIAHLRFVQHGYGPTDALDEKVRFLDNQIDVLSKATLGLTVSCARCHDHKFDPVSQADYHALFGILASDRPAQQTLRSREDHQETRSSLTGLRREIRREIAQAWHQATDEIEAILLTDRREESPRGERLRAALEVGKAGPWHPLHLWQRAIDTDDLRELWHASVAEYEASQKRVRDRSDPETTLFDADVQARWHSHGTGTMGRWSPPGELALQLEGDRLIRSILPSGRYTHLDTDRDSGVLTSPEFFADRPNLWFRGVGQGARVRYSVQHYPRVAGPPYKAQDMQPMRSRWQRFDLTYWEGDDLYLEFATARDIPVEARGAERSFFGIQEVRLLPRGAPGLQDEWAEHGAPLFRAEGEEPSDRPALARRLVNALRTSIERWGAGDCDDADVRFIGRFLEAGLLPVDRDRLPGVAALVDGYRERAAVLPTPVRVPGVLGGDRLDQPLYHRGDHTRPTDAIPQRFFEYFDATPYPRERRGRLQFAEDLVDAENPLPARVAVNRLWHWVFGEGLVRTPDNFGLLGQPPTHPELLDSLARTFIRDQWSIRSLLRTLVLTKAFQRSSSESVQQRELDPDNRWWSRMSVRRQEAEVIRDSLLAVSGRLDATRFGPSVNERSNRRSLYVSARQNALSPFLTVFDAPIPTGTVGRRVVTQVPAQALALLNDPIVTEAAAHWARRLQGDPALGEPAQRASRMVREVFGRAATPSEIEHIVSFVQGEEALRLRDLEEVLTVQEALDDLETERAELLEVGRRRVLETRNNSAGPSPSLPQPIARWDFDGDLTDSIGSLHGTAVRGAKVSDGRLILDGNGWVRTGPIGHKLREKTLEVWVELSDLGQSGGGAVTVQTPDGNEFDSIVFGERRRGEWMAGSDFFKRTQDVGGPVQKEARLRHVAVTYRADGTIQVFADGRPYGQPYDSTGPVEFDERAEVLLGMRHGTEGAPKTRLKGAIERAQLYDFALDPEEVLASSAGDPNFVSRGHRLAALEPAERTRLEKLERSIEERRAEQRELEQSDPGDAARTWRRVAHSLFNTKEFLFLR